MVYQYGNYTWELAGGQNVSETKQCHTTGFDTIMNVNWEYWCSLETQHYLCAVC